MVDITFQDGETTFCVRLAGKILGSGVACNGGRARRSSLKHGGLPPCVPSFWHHQPPPFELRPRGLTGGSSLDYSVRGSASDGSGVGQQQGDGQGGDAGEIS